MPLLDSDWCELCGEDHQGDCKTAFLCGFDDDDPNTTECAHEFVCTGTTYGGDDESYHGEGRCYCIHCGADGDA